LAIDVRFFSGNEQMEAAFEQNTENEKSVEGED